MAPNQRSLLEVAVGTHPAPAPPLCFPRASTYRAGHPADAAAQTDRFLVPASLAGLPAISVPAGAVGGLPLGVHLVAPAWDESTLLGVAGELDGVRLRQLAIAGGGQA